MVKRDYRTEVGAYVTQKNVPKPVAIAVMAAVLGVVTFSAAHIAGEAKKRHQAKQPAAAAQTPAH